MMQITWKFQNNNFSVERQKKVQKNNNCRADLNRNPEEGKTSWQQRSR